MLLSGAVKIYSLIQPQEYLFSFLYGLLNFYQGLLGQIRNDIFHAISGWGLIGHHFSPLRK